MTTTKLASALLALAIGGVTFAQSPQPSPAPAAAELPLFAVVVTVGAKWDAAKPPQDQALFREHSAHLKKLRDGGHLVMGARYSDKGLVILAAEDEAAARAMIDEDPSMKAETFRYEVYPFNVFYSGTLTARPRRPAENGSPR